MRWTTCDRSSSESLFDRGFRSACVRLIFWEETIEKRCTFPYRLCLEIHHFHGGAPPLSLSLSWCCTTWRICFLWAVLGDTAQVAAVSVVGPVFFDPCGSGDHAMAQAAAPSLHAALAQARSSRARSAPRSASGACFFSGAFWSASVCWVSRVPLLGVLGSNAEFFPYAERYLQVLALGCARFYILSNSMAMLVRAEGAVKEGLIGQSSGHAGQLHF